MKRIVGIFTLLAAVVLIGCSATSLFWTSFESANEPWQQWIQGAQIVAVIVWEAGAIMLIGYCFRQRWYTVGIGGSLLLVLAMGYTLSQELRLQAGTQADTAATIATAASARDLDRAELIKAIKRRDELQAIRRPSEAQIDELAAVRKDIATFKSSWNGRIEKVRAEGVPGAALIARLTGWNIQAAADLEPLTKVLFWTFARVFALPLAVLGLAALAAASAVSRKEASGEAKAASVAELAAQNVLPPIARPMPVLDAHPKPRHIDTERLGELGKLMREAAAADETPITTPPAGGGTPMPAVIEEKQVLPAKAENVVKLRPQEDMPTKAKSTTKGEGSVIRWLEECSSQDASEQQKTTSQACFKSYQAWCRINGYHAVNAKVLSRRIAAHLKMPASKSGKRNSSGRIFPTLVIYMPASETQRRYG